ncbi:hypothetical protein D3C71_2052990 [compost metagenome]
MTCITLRTPGSTPASIRFSRAEAASSRPKASVAPHTYFMACFRLLCWTVERMTILVGPGVKVTTTQYTRKAVRFMRTS